MSNYLELYDYRCQVADLYRERNQALLAEEKAEDVLQHFREGRNTLFASHPQSALDEEQRSHFQGLPYFPYQPELRCVADIDTSIPHERQMVAMNAEDIMPMTTIGRLHFEIAGQSVALSLYWIEIYGGGLFLPFRDTTSLTESYGGGRYLFDTIKSSDAIPGKHAKNQIILDFNYAYNPSCAYNSRWTCPLAPQENRLAIPIQAGEKKYS